MKTKKPRPGEGALRLNTTNSFAQTLAVQGYLAHKTPPPQDPTVGPCLGPCGGPRGGGGFLEEGKWGTMTRPTQRRSTRGTG